jgi:hypothetical protein
MRHLCITSLLLLTAAVVAHPGGGIVASGPDAVAIADPVNNVIWQVRQGNPSHAIAKKVHCHWMTRGLDQSTYLESLQQMGGAVFRLGLRTMQPNSFIAAPAPLLLVAEQKDIGALVFAVDREGSLIFQRKEQIVERRADGQVRPFRLGRGIVAPGEPSLGTVLAYAWRSEDALYLSDGDKVRRIDRDGYARVVATVKGTFLQPRIWNPIEVPQITGLAVDDKGRVLAAVPDIGEVIRIDGSGRQEVISRSEGGWRATGVAAYEDSVFVMESNDKQNVGPRVRVIRASGKVEMIGQIDSSSIGGLGRSFLDVVQGLVGSLRGPSFVPARQAR